MGIFASDFDGSQIKEFYDPHPGVFGAGLALPTAVKEVANKLNGQSISIDEAMSRIMAVTNDTVFLNPKDSFIGLEIYCGGRFDVSHSFCVIKFR